MTTETTVEENGDVTVVTEPEEVEEPTSEAVEGTALDMAVEATVTARLADEHASEAVETAEQTAAAVEQQREGFELWQTEAASRLSALEDRPTAMSREDLEALVRETVSDLHLQSASRSESTERPTNPETLEALAEDPATLAAASQATGETETNISATLTEASAETATEPHERNPEGKPGEAESHAERVPQSRVRFV